VNTKALCRFVSLVAFVCISSASLAATPQSVTPAPDYSAHASEVVSELATHQFDKVFAQFAPVMSSALPADKLDDVWSEVITQAGAFQKIVSSRFVERGGYHNAVVTCAFEKLTIDIVLSFDDSGHIAGLHFAPAENSASANGQPWTAPAYADPSKFHEEAVTISYQKWQLPGTLTLPNGKGPFPAVVLVSGSGPNDADETIGPNKPFKDLAWGLASKSVAVLRYPKRVRQYGLQSSADPQEFTVKDEYVDDARAAVALLASRSEINPKHIFLAGHSEGGYLAPRIAAGDSQIAGIIILEGETRPLERLVIDQLQYEAKLGGPNAAQIEAALPQVQAQAKAIEDPNLKPGTNLQLLTSNIPASYILDLRSYDPCSVAASLKIPVYVTQGGRDYQITTTDFAGWQKALAGHPNATLKLYPSLDHLLFAGAGPSKPEEYLLSGQHLFPEIVSDLAAWINSH
jgi:uncharacterized protein